MFGNERIKLKHLIDALEMYREEFGDEELITIGTSSEHDFIFMVGSDSIGNEQRLPIGQYMDRYWKEAHKYHKTKNKNKQENS